MAVDFSKFDEQVNMEQLQKDVKEAKENGYKEVPKGTYTGKIEKMELGETKDGRPMFKVQFRITEGDFKKSCLFMNKVVYGTKNDGSMISSVLGFLTNLDSEIEPIEFKGYAQFAELIMDIMEEIDEVLEYEVEYDPDAFNNISIKDVFEV